MPEPQPQEWAQAYARIQRLADRDVLAELRRAVRDINHMLRQIDPNLGRVGDLVRIQQLQTVKRNLLNRQSEIFTRMGDIIAARREAAAAAATNLGSAIDQVLFDAIGQGEVARQLKSSLNSGLAQTIDVAVTRITVSQVPLAQRIYNSTVRANGTIQKRINSALLRGLSAQEFAREARDWFNPDTPGGVRYAAFRLARTEINNAFHATSVIQAQEKPWIDNMQWHLSRSHPKADDCDRLAKGGPKGDGVYPKGEVPKKPHPQCFCFVTPVSPDEDEFLDNLVAGKYDQYLRQKMGQAQAKPKAEPKKVQPKKKTAPKKATQPQSPIAPDPTPAPEPTDFQKLHKMYGQNLHVLDQSKQVDKHLSHLGRVPDEIHAVVAKHFASYGRNSGIYIGKGAVPDLSPESAKLRGVQPRGWPDGSTWDQVPGAYSPSTRQLLIGDENKHQHGCTSLANHEFGHAVSDAVPAGQFHGSGAFSGPATILDRSQALHLSPYYSASGNTGWLSEMYAESFSSWSIYKPGAKSREELIYHMSNSLGYVNWDYATDSLEETVRKTLEPGTIQALGDIIDLFGRIGK